MFLFNFLNAGFTVGVSGTWAKPAFNSLETRRKEVKALQEQKSIEVANNLYNGGAVQLNLGWLLPFTKRFGMHFVGSYGTYFNAHIYYSTGNVEDSNIKRNPRAFTQVAIKPYMMFTESFGIHGIVGIKATGDKSWFNPFSSAKDRNEWAGSMPLGLGLCMKLGSSVLLHLEGTYNSRFETLKFDKDNDLGNVVEGWNVTLGVDFHI